MNELRERWEEQLSESLVEKFYLTQTEDEKQEGFQYELKFGTAGIRGKFGLGEGRLNKFTVQKIALGIVHYLQHEQNPSIVIHFDTRHLSQEFALIFANTFSQFNIKTYLPNTYKTTPELSFAVRNLQTSLGIMITASHNPPNYNGIKVYGADGAQLSVTESEVLSHEIEKLGNPLNIQTASKQSLYIQELPEGIQDQYFEQIKASVGQIPKSDLRVTFSSLHGTSVPITPQLLEKFNFKNYVLVKEQCVVDPDFSSVKSANPEDHEAFNLSIDYAHHYDAHLMIATDPDADRIGIAIRDRDHTITYLNGNEIGALLLNYQIKKTRHVSNRVAIQSIVTSILSDKLAERNNIKMYHVLTGFKFIAEKIKQINTNPEENFIFAFEESYGYLAADFVRDKDAIQIIPLIIKYASELQLENKTLRDELNDIYATVGQCQDKLFSHTFDGVEGKAHIQNIMTKYRNNTPTKIGNLEVLKVEDYQNQQSHDLQSNRKTPIDLPKADVIKLIFNEGFIALRPSGTEPKIKLYVSLETEDFENVSEEMNQFIFNK